MHVLDPDRCTPLRRSHDVHGDRALGTQPLASRLGAWRTGQQMSVPAAARLFGVHPSTYLGWERGRRPYARHLEEIAEVLAESLAVINASAGPPRRRPRRPAAADASLLTRARHSAGLNRVELGRRLHVGPATVYKWERGTVRPPQELLPDLARLLDVTRQELDKAFGEHPPSRSDGKVLHSLGEVLRDRGWSRKAVHGLLEASPTSVFEWETGRTRVPDWALRRLAPALGTDSETLISAARARSVPAPAGVSLRDLRRCVGMTQREAAAHLGVSACSLGRYENGRRPVDIQLGRRMARLYCVPLARVLTVAGVNHRKCSQPTDPETSSGRSPNSNQSDRQSGGLRAEPSRHPEVTTRTYRATLDCGGVLTYEDLTFVPDVAEVVPCRRHGYCPVAARDHVDVRRVGGQGRTVQGRSQAELLDFLRRRPVTSVHSLRRNRFTLRTVRAAERNGLVQVDLLGGRIALRTATAG